MNYMPDPALPEAVRARPPTPVQHAREMYGLASEWDAYSWEARGEGASAFLVLKGGIYRHAILRGPRKGSTNYRKPEPGSEATVSVPCELHENWLATWENETGLCHKCKGTGHAWAGWNHIKGNAYRACGRCNATGSVTER